jgi:hypothetical protein
MKTRTPVDGDPEAHEDGSAWLLGAVLTGGARWRGAERSGREEEEENDFSFDFSPRATKVEAEVTRGAAEQLARSVWGRRRNWGAGRNRAAQWSRHARGALEGYRVGVGLGPV